MIKNILNIVGWLGTALVVAAVAVRFLRPEWDQYAVYAAYSMGAGVHLSGGSIEMRTSSAASAGRENVRASTRAKAGPNTNKPGSGRLQRGMVVGPPPRYLQRGPAYGSLGGLIV